MNNPVSRFCFTLAAGILHGIFRMLGAFFIGFIVVAVMARYAQLTDQSITLGVYLVIGFGWLALLGAVVEKFQGPRP